MWQLEACRDLLSCLFLQQYTCSSQQNKPRNDLQTVTFNIIQVPQGACSFQQASSTLHNTGVIVNTSGTMLVVPPWKPVLLKHSYILFTGWPLYIANHHITPYQHLEQQLSLNCSDINQIFSFKWTGFNECFGTFKSNAKMLPEQHLRLRECQQSRLGVWLCYHESDSVGD